MNKPAGKSPIRTANPASEPGTRQLLLVWYLRVGISMVVLALVFGSKFTTPVHAELSGEWVFPLMLWGLTCLLAAFVAGIASGLLGLIHRPGGDFGLWVAANLLFAGVVLICAQHVAEGVNVHFAASPPTRVTAKILRIEPSGGKSLPTVYLAYWGAENPTRGCQRWHESPGFPHGHG